MTYQITCAGCGAPSSGRLDCPVCESLYNTIRHGPALAYGAPLRDLPRLAADVPCITLQQPYAGLVAAVKPWANVGLKDIETRKWTIKPGVYVVCAGKAVDADGWRDVSGDVPYWARSMLNVTGEALCLVEVGASRPLVPADRPRAWFYAPDRKAMEILRAWPFRKRWAQKGGVGLTVKVRRMQVLQALAGGAS